SFPMISGGDPKVSAPLVSGERSAPLANDHRSALLPGRQSRGLPSHSSRGLPSHSSRGLPGHSSRGLPSHPSSAPRASGQRDRWGRWGGTLPLIAVAALLTLIAHRETALGMVELWSRSRTYAYAWLVLPAVFFLLWN